MVMPALRQEMIQVPLDATSVPQIWIGEAPHRRLR